MIAQNGLVNFLRHSAGAVSKRMGLAAQILGCAIGRRSRFFGRYRFRKDIGYLRTCIAARRKASDQLSSAMLPISVA